ncbi:MAG: translocation/assembly module TamB domain-containing protein, partial [Burkholderiaceae bacterium]|nr:translocation/assembly module TamB domain-containing protein [Burkholderiaceae bacterium]
RGTYKAYGQQLSIEQGLLRFTGPYDNPSLDILAIRPNLQQRVGVQISGTARAPVVRLYAEPELAEADKLAWLILGRSAANGGAESALLQQAALALLGGNGKSLSGSLAQALGLDELSMRGASSDGTTTGATVMLGKHISRDFYVVFERSLTSTLGTLYIFYDLSRRFTLRAQAGTQSAVDLIFTVRYD